MKINKVIIENFRCYENITEIDFEDLTVFVGKNDIGKSTILEALEIFFNGTNKDAIIKIEKADINLHGMQEENNDIIIGVEFDELPSQIIIDSSYNTTLLDEYLLSENGNLTVIKKYPNAGKEKVYIRANHPTNTSCSDLLLKKRQDLQRILDSNSIECENRNINSIMRKAIWNFYSDDLKIDTIDIDASKEGAKAIWEQLNNYMPLYSLFQCDRKNSDGDSEIQNPMKLAVKEILAYPDIKSKLENIAEQVVEKLNKVAEETLEKLNEMNPEIAENLTPQIPPAETLKWNDVFKNVSILGDDDIPINKRGSGVKRLVLINFFRAEAERRKAERKVPSIIYAIEEPETSQHPEYQRDLINALKDLSLSDNAQIILTTHSPAIVKVLNFDNLKLVKDIPTRQVINIERSTLKYPSLNEVNYLAFNEACEEYHNELYGHIEIAGEFQNYKSGKSERTYIQLNRDSTTTTKLKILSEYIRHQIHHPENTHNIKYTSRELKQSIDDMRTFIETNNI